MKQLLAEMQEIHLYMLECVIRNSVFGNSALPPNPALRPKSKVGLGAGNQHQLA